METLRYGAGMAVADRAKIEREQAMLAERAGAPAKGVYVAAELFEQRAASTTATASTIAADNYRPDLFTSALTNSAIVSRLGATTLTGLTGDVIIPRETGSPNVGWVAEDQALPTGNATFDSLTLTPHHVGTITELSRQLLQQSSPQVEQLVRSMMSRNVALEIDRAAIAGSGTGAEPLGLLNDVDVPEVAFATDLFTTTANMIAAADITNIGDTRAFLSTNGVRADAMKERDTTGRPIPLGDTFHGESAYFTNQAPNDLGVGTDEHGMVYGDFRDLLIGIWSQLDILTNPYAETAYSKGNILVRAMATVALRKGSASLLRKLISRVEVGRERIRVAVDCSKLASHLGTSLKPGSSPGFVVHVDARLRRSGKVVRLVQNDGEPASPAEPQQHLVKLMQLANSWWKEMQEDGLGATELAVRHQVDKTYVSRVVRLGFLSPKIAHRILAGEQPPALNARRLLGLRSIPLSWAEQEKLLLSY